jgi:subtilisin-like proprotein convertase family protein
MKRYAIALGTLAAAGVIAVTPLPAQAAVTTLCSTAGGTNCTSRIPDAQGAIAGNLVSTMTVAACPGGATVTNVQATVNITHTWVGDLQLLVSNPGATTTAALLSNLPDMTGSVGGCQWNDVTATFSETGPAPVCDGPVAGVRKSATTMAPFVSGPISGTWTLNVKDTQNSGEGILNDWSIIVSCMLLDVDGNKQAGALTDGLLVLRFLFGLTGPALTSGAIGDFATRTDPAAILAYLNAIKPQLDVDGNGSVDALTDGVMILRYLLGVSVDQLTSGALGSGATRTTGAAVKTYIDTLVN